MVATLIVTVWIGSGTAAGQSLFCDFESDVVGAPPATGGDGQPTSFSGYGTVTVENAALGMPSQAVVIRGSCEPEPTFLRFDFDETTTIRVEATTSLQHLIDAYVAFITTVRGVLITRIGVNRWGDVYGEYSNYSGTIFRVPVGRYVPGQPFRMRMDVDGVATTWSVTIDDELDGFSNDQVVPNIKYLVRQPAHPTTVARAYVGIDGISASGGVGCTDQTSIACDNVLIGSVVDGDEICFVADRVLSYSPGIGTNQNLAWQSTGYPDGWGTPIGSGGVLVTAFPAPAPDGPGDDIRVYELGLAAGAVDENYRVEASRDAISWAVLGVVAGGTADFDLASASLSEAMYVRIHDLAPIEDSTEVPNIGADIDAIAALHCAPVELSCVNGYDDDGDTYGDCADTDCQVDVDGDGYAAQPCGGDCDDMRAYINPMRAENCLNGIDDDCDGFVDCADGACATVDSDGDGLQDCNDPCADPDARCQWFTWVSGGVESPDTKFDIVVAYDVGLGGESWQDDLAAEVYLLAATFATLPSTAGGVDQVSFWSGAQRVEEVQVELSDGRTVRVYEDYIRQAWAWNMDALIVRRASGGDFTTIITGKGVLPVAQISTDPNVDIIPLLHELGHAAFGLADEYPTSIFSGCSGTPCEDRVSVVRAEDPPANVWGSEDACVAAGFEYPCHRFCSYDWFTNGVWRLGDEENPNLMRAACENHGVLSVNGYGEAGGARVREMLGALEYRDNKDQGASGQRQAVFQWTITGGTAATDSIYVMRGQTPAQPPAGTALHLQLLDHDAIVVGHQAVWDPRFVTVHDTVMTGDPVPLTVTVPLGPRGHHWRLLDRRGDVMTRGSLGAQFLNYCQRVNFTDSECLSTDSDQDSVPDGYDNCPDVANADQTDVDGNGYGDVCELSHIPEDRAMPLKFIALENNRPNPFNPATDFAFYIQQAGMARLEVFSVRGERVAVVFERYFTAGRHVVQWLGTDDSGRKIGSGAYIARLQANGAIDSQKIMIVK